MLKLFIMIGSINAFLAVALGAFGAHGLQPRLSERMFEIYQTGVQYHMIHALGIILVGILADKFVDSTAIVWAGWALFIGIILFSGSLYVLSVTGITKLGAITPIGGVAFLIGWILVAVAAFRA
ncbi:DUF423 domain-containing protein [Anaerobacillus sp. MEB173]|uniref:DUF423 domain-containing protein n=1 Tax=Anaerobacillus sp. MEB173 TaxID=3383345 RepID=UPI003F92C953